MADLEKIVNNLPAFEKAIEDNTKLINEEKTKGTTPLDADFYSKTNIIFKQITTSDFTEKLLTLTGEKALAVRRDYGDKEIRFLILEKFAKMFSGSLINSFSKRVLFAIASIAYAKKEKTITATKSEMLKCLGYNDAEIAKGGKIFKDLNDAIRGLMYVTLEINNKKDGKEYKEVIGHLLNQVKIEGKEEGKYAVELNDFTIDAVKTFYESYQNKAELPAGTGQYISHPNWLTADRTLTKYERNFCEFVVGLQGIKRTYEYKLITLLTKHTGIGNESILASRAKCYKIFNRCYEVAIKNKLLTDRAITPDKHWQNSKVRLFLPTKKNLESESTDTLPAKPTEQTSYAKPKDPMPDILALTDRLVKWHLEPDFKTTKSADGIKSQIYNTICAYGVKAIKKISVEPDCTHPDYFWKRVKQLKQ